MKTDSLARVGNNLESAAVVRETDLVVNPAPTPLPTETDVTTKRRRERAERVIVRLNRICKDFPEFRRIMLEPIEQMHEQAERTPETDRQLVLAAVHLGAWIVNEIQSETNLSRRQVQRHLDNLVENKIVITTTRPADGREGRPETLYLPAPTCAEINHSAQAVTSKSRGLHAPSANPTNGRSENCPTAEAGAAPRDSRFEASRGARQLPATTPANSPLRK